MLRQVVGGNMSEGDLYRYGRDAGDIAGEFQRERQRECRMQHRRTDFPMITCSPLSFASVRATTRSLTRQP